MDSLDILLIFSYPYDIKMTKHTGYIDSLDILLIFSYPYDIKITKYTGYMDSLDIIIIFSYIYGIKMTKHTGYMDNLDTSQSLLILSHWYQNNRFLAKRQWQRVVMLFSSLDITTCSLFTMVIPNLQG